MEFLATSTGSFCFNWTPWELVAVVVMGSLVGIPPTCHLFSGKFRWKLSGCRCDFWFSVLVHKRADGSAFTALFIGVLQHPIKYWNNWKDHNFQSIRTCSSQANDRPALIPVHFQVVHLQHVFFLTIFGPRTGVSYEEFIYAMGSTVGDASLSGVTGWFLLPRCRGWILCRVNLRTPPKHPETSWKCRNRQNLAASFPSCEMWIPYAHGYWDHGMWPCFVMQLLLNT